MAYQGIASVGDVKTQDTIATLGKSIDKTIGYFTGTWIFYMVLISFFIFLVLTPDKPEVRGANTGILILLCLAFLGLWTSPLRGLKGEKVGAGRFLNLFQLPLTDKLNELRDAGNWGSKEERSRYARELLEHQAELEKEARSPKTRLISLIVITVINLLIWLVWKNLTVALINQVIATVVSQVHISLAPSVCLKAIEHRDD